jgi:hypothetical protein
MNSIHQPQLAWLLWSLFLVIIWSVIYVLLKNKESRKEMIVVSLWTSLLGFTEPLFVPEYWNPPSLFDLAHRTGFDIESFIFSFAIGGIVVVIYEHIFLTRHDAMSVHSQNTSRHSYHFLALLSAPIIFITLSLTTSLNPIYTSAIALIFGGFATWWCRPDLKKKMITSAFLFLGLYFVYFLTLIAMYPGYVEKVWNLSAISKVLIVGIPLEELMFAFSFGFFWSSIYEHFTWKSIKQ